MHAASTTLSSHLETFRCIGPACEDTCCRGWNVPVDRFTYERYQKLPPSELTSLIAASVRRRQADSTEAAIAADASADHPWEYAKIYIEGTNPCPLLTSEGLCRIHAELGEGMLCYACATYPRIVHEFGGLKETALALSCPEAARLVLLSPDLLSSDLHDSGPRLADGSVGGDAAPLPPHFLDIRRSVLALLRMRSYPLWQRMFLLSLLCRRLDSIARGELNRSVPEFLDDFKRAVATGSLRPAMATLPEDRAAQLDIVLRLAGLMLHRSRVTPRFSASIQAFTAGIGNGPGATLDSLSRQYARAHDLVFEPFFRRHPHIFENYLVNAIVRCQFPFGPEGLKPGAKAERTGEFAKLAAQFALIRGLLIGVAGFHGLTFSTAHVVATVQSAAKHFEHHPQFLKLAHELLLESRMDGARGTAILLREAAQETVKTESPAVPAPQPHLETRATPAPPDL